MTVGNNIVFIGFMGTGKSTLGAMLAKELGMEHVDLDQAIIEHEQSDIPTIFQTKGEAYFRDVEAKLLAELLTGSNLVLTTGGGAVLRAENVKHMMEHALVVALHADQDEIVRRVSLDTNRPLLAGDAAKRVATLLEQRKGAYDFAQIHIDTTGQDVNELVKEIIKKRIEYRDFRGE